MIKIKDDKLNYGICLPNHVNEITKGHLIDITKNVNLSEHYCIIALCFSTTIFNFCSAINTKNSANISVLPLIAKISDKDSELINANVGDKVIIDRSSLERGIHININTAISSNFVRKYFYDSPELLKNALANKNIAIDGDNKHIVVVEFKICPINDIVATVPRNVDNTDPFIFGGVSQ